MAATLRCDVDDCDFVVEAADEMSARMVMGDHRAEAHDTRTDAERARADRAATRLAADPDSWAK